MVTCAVSRIKHWIVNLLHGLWIMLKIECNTLHLFLGLASGFFPLSSLTVYISSFPCSYRMIRPSHPSRLDHPNDV